MSAPACRLASALLISLASALSTQCTGVESRTLESRDLPDLVRDIRTGLVLVKITPLSPLGAPSFYASRFPISVEHYDAWLIGDTARESARDSAPARTWVSWTEASRYCRAFGYRMPSVRDYVEIYELEKEQGSGLLRLDDDIGEWCVEKWRDVSATFSPRSRSVGFSAEGDVPAEDGRIAVVGAPHESGVFSIGEDDKWSDVGFRVIVDAEEVAGDASGRWLPVEPR